MKRSGWWWVGGGVVIAGVATLAIIRSQADREDAERRYLDQYSECVLNGMAWFDEIGTEPLRGRSTWVASREWCDRDLNHWPRRSARTYAPKASVYDFANPPKPDRPQRADPKFEPRSPVKEDASVETAAMKAIYQQCSPTNAAWLEGTQFTGNAIRGDELLVRVGARFTRPQFSNGGELLKYTVTFDRDSEKPRLFRAETDVSASLCGVTVDSDADLTATK